MFRKVFFLMATVVALTTACNQGSNKISGEQKADTVLIAVASFDTSAYNYVEKPIWIEGTVFHTCKHGGKRLFLVDGSDSIRVEVTTGPNIPKFDESLVGNRIRVLGILKEERIDTKYLNEWEAEIKQPKAEEKIGLHSGAKGHEDQDIEEKLAQVYALRETLKESGKDHLSFYTVEAISFTELK